METSTAIRFAHLTGCEVIVPPGDYRPRRRGLLQIRVTRRLPHLDHTDQAGRDWYGVAGIQVCPDTGRDLGPQVVLLHLSDRERRGRRAAWG